MASYMCSEGAGLQPGGPSLTSPNGLYSMYLGLDAILYWEDNTTHATIAVSNNPPQSAVGVTCIVTPGGLLEVVGASVLWWAGTPGGAACVYIQDDGHIAVIVRTAGGSTTTWRWVPPVWALTMIVAAQNAQIKMESVRKHVETAGKAFFRLLAYSPSGPRPAIEAGGAGGQGGGGAPPPPAPTAPSGGGGGGQAGAAGRQERVSDVQELGITERQDKKKTG
jgi:hypothetical protein